VLLNGREKLFSVMSWASWSYNLFMHGFMVQCLLLSIKMLSINVAEFLAVLMGKYTVLIKL
jgi:hypothetical protein